MGMKRWSLRIAVVLSALAVMAVGSRFIWQRFWSADQFREAVAEGIETGDFSRAERLKRWGADTRPWREEDSAWQLRDAVKDSDVKRTRRLLALGAPVEGDDTRSNPLWWAMDNSHAELARMLLESAAGA